MESKVILWVTCKIAAVKFWNTAVFGLRYLLNMFMYVALVFKLEFSFF